MTVGFIKKIMNLSKFWTVLTIPLSVSSSFEVDFFYGSAGGDVLMKQAEEFYIWHERFNDWKCGMREESAICKEIEYGNLAWSGKYILTKRPKGKIKM